MKISKRFTGLILLMVLSLCLVSCSHSKSPVEPSIDDQQEPIAVAESNSNRSVLAVYDAVIDQESGTFEVTPAERSAQYHYPLTQLYPNVLKVIGYGFSPFFWADIKLTHPLPGSGIDAFDPRVIAILPANPGVSFHYPVFNCIGNNKVVLEPDGYTKLFDNLGGSIPGNTNPFLAYFKHVEYRRWFSSGTGMTSDTRRWDMDINGFGGPIVFKLVVDISTNFPNPPQPVIDNAPEPVEMNAIVGSGLTLGGGTALIEVTLRDWQGASDIRCKVESPDLFTGVVQLLYSRPGPNPNEYIFSGSVSNTLLAPEGTYNILVAAWDIPTDIHIFDEATAIVSSDIDFNPADITPPWLNFSPQNIFVEGDYAYVAAGHHGLHIFNISNPLNLVWVNKIDTSGFTIDVQVTAGYAYVADSSALSIIDINPPESAYIVNSIVTLGIPMEVSVSGGYAYIADNQAGFGLEIIDIDPPESAYVVKSIDTPGSENGITVSGGYAYVTNDYSGLEIFDVDPPESSYLVNTVSMPQGANGVYISGNYAYVADSVSGLKIVDINPPESANIVKTVDTPGVAYGVHVSYGYAYVADMGSGLQIIDVDPPQSAYIVNSVGTPGDSRGVFVSGDYAYVADSGQFHIIDINPPEEAQIVNSKSSAAPAYRVAVSGSYAYVSDWYTGLQIVDINPPETSRIIKTVNMSYPYDIRFSDGYAYVLALDGGVHIVDIDPPESAYIVKTVEIPENFITLDVSDGYAYVGHWADDLHIIDIDPPEDAHIVKIIDNLHADCVRASNGFAYVGSGGLLKILDVDPPESAYTISEVNYNGTLSGADFFMANGYAYIPGLTDFSETTYFNVIDVDPPETAYLVKSISTNINDDTYGEVYVSNGYAYYTGISRVHIIDIDPLDTAHVVQNFDLIGELNSIQVADNYAYVAARNGGMRIFKLW